MSDVLPHGPNGASSRHRGTKMVLAVALLAKCSEELDDLWVNWNGSLRATEDDSGKPVNPCETMVQAVATAVPKWYQQLPYSPSVPRSWMTFG